MEVFCCRIHKCDLGASDVKRDVFLNVDVIVDDILNDLFNYQVTLGLFLPISGGMGSGFQSTWREQSTRQLDICQERANAFAAALLQGGGTVVRGWCICRDVTVLWGGGVCIWSLLY